MSTVTDDLLIEGKETLASNNAEDIHRFADRVVSVEPDNWYGLYMRGCGYALDNDLSNCVANFRSAAENIEDESVAAELLPTMCQLLAECIVRQDGSVRLDFSRVGEFMNTMNDRLPECDDEVIVTDILGRVIEYIGANKVPVPLIAYYGCKALVVTAFRAYVQLGFFPGFFQSLKQIGEILIGSCDEKSIKLIRGDVAFIDAVIGAIESAVSDRPEEDLGRYEDYWLSHKLDSYVGHIMQAYQLSAASANGGFLAKMSTKMMNAEIQTFIKIYFSAKIE
ncbi:MAG: hypothetical protein MJZ38_04645 [archaeon]|nr:hypothetical protein [archaeon]